MNKCPSKACACAVLSAWLLLSLIALVVTVYLYLKPFLQVVRYSRTECVVRNAFYRSQFICECGDVNCNSSYPCFMVQVSLDVSGHRDTLVPLFADIHQQRVVMQTSRQEQEKVCHC